MYLKRITEIAASMAGTQQNVVLLYVSIEFFIVIVFGVTLGISSDLISRMLLSY